MTADLIIENARILTMDAVRPRAEAVAVRGGRIVALGTNDQVSAFASSTTRRVDAGGATVLPGFVESHIHLFAGGAQLDNLSLAGLDGFEAIAAAIRGRAASHPDEKLIMVEQVVYSIFGPGQPITRHVLDRILPERPLALYAADHHTMWGNTAALKLAGLLHGRELSPGNEILMGKDGLAEGELREFEAFAPLIALTPTGGRETLGLLAQEPRQSPTAAQRAVDKDILRRGMAHCASLGITSFHNMDGNAYQLELLQEIDEAEGLICRGRIPFRILPDTPLSSLAEAVAWRQRWNSDRLKADFVKIFMDGVIDATNAFMLADFGGLPGVRGSAYFEQDQFDEICIEVDRLGFQIAVHAIGDAAVRRTLNGYEAARKANGPRDSRHRVEHIETLDPADIGRFAELDVICSMQPTHGPGSVFPPEPGLTLIGPERMKTAFAWQTLRNTGAKLCFSSDWPVAPLDPFVGIKAAMMRPRAPGAPDERQTLGDSLSAFTLDSAYAEFAEDRKGVLKPGAFADIAVLAGNVEAASPETIDRMKVAMTICDGRITYET
jgi:predicted amidohydrolase YtcJ